MKAIKILFYNFKISLLNELAHKANFLMRFLSDSIFFFVYFVFYTVIYSYVSNINGWGKYDMLFLMGTFHIIISIFTAFFIPNLAQIPGMVKGGGLDTYLVKPIDSRFILSTHSIDIGSLVNILLGVAIIFVSLKQLDIKITVASFLLYAIYIFVGVSIMYSTLFVLVCTIFWLNDSMWSIGFFMTFNSFADKPVSIYKGIIYRFLVYIFPMGLVANIPASVMLNKENRYLEMWFIIAAILLLNLSKYIWNKGLKHYEGASI